MPFGSDLYFCPNEASKSERSIHELEVALARRLYPLGVVDSGNAFLLMDALGECFTLFRPAADVCYLGPLRSAIESVLTWINIRPVLPRRDYPQWHGVSVYPPDDPRVFWIDSVEWLGYDIRARPEDIQEE